MFWGWLSKGMIVATGALITLVLGAWTLFVEHTWSETRVVFLSVGQGDAILITRGSHQIIIDGGREGKRLLSHLGRHMPFYDRTIEAVIATHPDADHIGGFPELFRQYHVEHFFTTGATSETDTWKRLEKILEESFDGDELPAILGTDIEIPDGGEFTILFPATPLPPEADETNTGSVVARFVFGKTSFLLTGDLGEEELYLPETEQATVLKVAHHGSRFSTSDAWLDLVKPVEAVISVGENRYGHPHPEVLSRLERRGIAVFRTDTLGDIVYRCRAEWEGCKREE